VTVPFPGFEALVNQGYLRQAAWQAADKCIRLRVQAKNPGLERHPRTVDMQFNYQDAFAVRRTTS
jgi:hypothetical protein